MFSLYNLLNINSDSEMSEIDKKYREKRDILIKDINLPVNKEALERIEKQYNLLKRIGLDEYNRRLKICSQNHVGYESYIYDDDYFKGKTNSDKALEKLLKVIDEAPTSHIDPAKIADDYAKKFMDQDPIPSKIHSSQKTKSDFQSSISTFKPREDYSMVGKLADSYSEEFMNRKGKKNMKNNKIIKASINPKIKKWILVALSVAVVAIGVPKAIKALDNKTIEINKDVSTVDELDNNDNNKNNNGNNMYSFTYVVEYDESISEIRGRFPGCMITGNNEGSLIRDGQHLTIYTSDKDLADEMNQKYNDEYNKKPDYYEEYVIEYRDTLPLIAEKMGVSVQDIIDSNEGIDTGSIIYEGQTLKIPRYDKAKTVG